MKQDDTNLGRVVGANATFLDALGEAAGDGTMGMQQVQLLLQLYIHGEIPQVDLKKFTGVDKSANSRNIAKLGMGEKPTQKTGPMLVEAYDDLNDRRFKLVRLTARGKHVVEAAAKKAAKLLL